jgi:hypothetical protein
MLNVRLVHLPDEQKRKELMIIYAEDTAFAGVAWTDLFPGGKAAGQWPDIQKALEERAETRIVLHQIGRTNASRVIAGLQARGFITLGPQFGRLQIRRDHGSPCRFLNESYVLFSSVENPALS